MTSPSLGRLLISHITLRGPELAQIFMLIAAHSSISYGDLVDAMLPSNVRDTPFGLEEAPLREALNFLLVARLIEQQGPSRLKASFRATPLLENAPFALQLLHHMYAHTDERQRAPALIYQVLVADDVISINPAALRERMERGLHRSLFTWTSEKISFWGHLVSFIGLLRRSERELEWLVVPQPNLILHALQWACSQTATSSLDTLLEHIDTHLFACFTARGRVHRGLAQTLLALERTKQLALTHHADAAHSLLLGERRVSDVGLKTFTTEASR